MPAGGGGEATAKKRGGMASLARPDELNIQTASSRLQPEGGSDRLHSVLTSEQNIRRTAGVPAGSRLEQLQIQQQQPNQNFRSGWQFGKMHCAVISILMIVLLLTLLDVWMAYLDSGLSRSDPRASDVRNLTRDDRNLTSSRES